MNESAPRASLLPRTWCPLTMGSGLRAAMQRAPAKTAVIHGPRSISYSELVRRADLATGATLRAGLKPGENAAIVARNCIEFFEVVIGVPEAGVAIATVNPRYTTSEIEAVCDDAEARVVFTDSSSADLVRAGRYRSVERIIEFGPEYEAWLGTGEAPIQRPRIEEWDTWTIPYTSGTTGKPKGVLLSHRGRTLIAFGSAVEFGCFSPDDRFLAMTPLNHGGGLAFPMGALLMGGSVELVDRFDPLAVLEKLKIFALDAALLERYRRPPLRAIISNAAPLPQAMKEKIVPFFGENVLFEIYSSTEAGFVSSLRPADQLRKMSCVGLPQSQTQLKVLTADGRECAPEEVGEIWSRSPWLFNGYWRRDAETDAAVRDGWVSVGDMGKRDAEGYLYIVDRKKDMIISGGVNIYPREIEEVLLRHPAIADAAVVGVADEKWGERPRAFLVLREQASFGIEEMVSFCTGRLSAYKIPRELRVVDALPRNANGKVLKTELRTRA
jgi:acyl-CoA synthetase (AMP-forming)/AMP-acid ligase II